MIVARGFPLLGLLLFAMGCGSDALPKYDPSKHERAYQLYDGPRLPDAKVAYISPAPTSRWGIRLDTIDGKAIKRSGVVAVLPGRHVLGVRTKWKWSFKGSSACADLVFRAEAGRVYRVVPAKARGRRRRHRRRYVMQVVNQQTGFAVAEARIRRRGFLEGGGPVRGRCTPRGT